MKIVLTAGGTGGHFYPLMAVAEAIHNLEAAEKLVPIKLYYLADKPYDPQALFNNQVEFRGITAGKRRRYFSLRNYLDLFKIGIGILGALATVFRIFPDVVFSKGGYVSFPVLFAARLFRIPIVIHESDSKPGRVNLWASKFATKIAVSYPEAAAYFPISKTAVTGNPIRPAIREPITEGAREFLGLDPQLPVILLLGGSQGAKRINDTLLDCLPRLVESYQIIHQTGAANLAEVTERANFILKDSPQRDHYKPFAYLNETALKMSAGVASLVVSRAGSTIFEIATWGLPSIIIPIPENISHDQRTNAFTYARTGAAEVIEEENLSTSVFESELRRLISNPELLKTMRAAAKNFARGDAAATIARELVNIGLTHER